MQKSFLPEAKKLKVYLLLHVLLMIYSVGGILSKAASGVPFLSLKFILLYGGVILILGIYAIGWQQVIKRLPLTEAYMNKAITFFWSLLWGVLFFREQITLKKILGVLVITTGILLYSAKEADSE